MHPESAHLLSLLDQFFPAFEPELKSFIAREGSLREVAKGELMIRPRQYFKSVMLLIGGRVKLYREGDEGNEFFMYYIQPGQACALSMICAAKSEQSEVLAKAVETVQVITVPIHLMDDMMKQYRSWYYFVIETYRSRFEELLDAIDAIAFRSMDERLEFYLKNQAKQQHSSLLHLTHQEIANDLNSSREVISRLLKKMEARGEIMLARNEIRICDTL
ncbi:CRP/FNR family transcriptional regulator, anaerobic regulatory protein [Catalinimonas alkaloidigena]|uniref:CRP/FNR family transcriptional regulator, anaerobic regulatory protein n=1 Tax=Catalinimonas alkaloidigena TaxID=1075417 RepID=A0A1G9AUD0_9BACT|nr:Crp/Fnr family transcriptional regulator [Catalinimonas alkaloidigena]SDK30250.1 CRP/FNR family transcriptional regulator, anaerobic regulatory protein [Catalinimonas alkaloidigena]